jgi:hypothetical protein
MNLNRILINMPGQRETDQASYLGQHVTKAVRFIRSLNVTMLINATRVQLDAKIGYMAEKGN